MSKESEALELIKEIVEYTGGEGFVEESGYGAVECVYCREENGHDEDCWFERAKKLVEG